MYIFHLSVIGRGKRYDVRQHNLAFLCCLLLKSIPTFMCVWKKTALNLSWPFEKGWETWEDMSIEAIRTGGALNNFRKRDASMTASKIEVGKRTYWFDYIQHCTPSPLFLFSNTPLKPLDVRGEQSPADGVKWRKKMLLKVLRNRKTKNGLPLFVNMLLHFAVPWILKVIKCTNPTLI